ncbi:MAG TPA: sodium:sulfate symporter [Betaproteobacteria bacterium]|nr:sodium:sulfate symporter [Betaproteobacteria bacterium]
MKRLSPPLAAVFHSPGRLAALAAILGAGCLALCPPAALPPHEAKAAALVIFAIALWATAALPEYLTALAFFLLAMLFSVAPPSVIFSGFAAGALWLIFGGLAIGAALNHTGLGERIANRMTARLGNRYATIIGGMVAIGVLLGFLMPSSIGRVVLLIPIALALADRFGFAAGSKGRTGLVLAAAFGSHVPPFAILPANVPNMVLIGASETLYHFTPTYGSYLLLHFPVLGLLKSLVIVGLIVWLYPDRPRLAPPAAATAAAPLSWRQRRLAAVLILALALWMTDSLHHISPAWVSLGAGLICLLPGIGVLPPRAFNELNYRSLFFVAGILGLGALVAHSGLGDLLAHGMQTLLPLKKGENGHNFTVLVAIASTLGLVTTLPGVPAVLTPLAGKFALASGLPLHTVLMSQVVGFSTTLLPYESAPLVVAMQLGGLSMKPAVKLSLALAAVTIIILLPLDFLWWRLLGWI